MIKNKTIIAIIGIFFMVNVSLSEASISETGSKIERYQVTPSMKKLILSSVLKTSIRNQSGKKIMVYMYADDEESKLQQYYFHHSADTYTSVTKYGHYYLYFYNVSTDLFLSERISLFKDFDGMSINMKEKNFFTWTSMSKNNSDIVFIGQPYAGEVDLFEAYGLSKNQLHIKKYWFNRNKKREEEFYGRINIQEPESDGTLVAYSALNYKIYQYKFHLTDTLGEIKLVPYDLPSSGEGK